MASLAAKILLRHRVSPISRSGKSYLLTIARIRTFSSNEVSETLRMFAEAKGFHSV